MGLRFPQQIFGSCFFVTTSFHEWRKYGEIEGVYSAVANSIKFCLEKYDALLPGYVLMPSHVHLLLVIDGRNLADFMRDFKKFVSQKALKEYQISDTRIWMPRYDRLAVYSEQVFRQKLDYIHNNPAKSGLVGVAEEWAWSSARCYALDEQGPLPVWRDWLL